MTVPRSGGARRWHRDTEVLQATRAGPEIGARSPSSLSSSSARHHGGGASANGPEGTTDAERDTPGAPSFAPDAPGLGLTIEQHATWRVASTEEGAALTQQVQPARYYSRWGNPTTMRLESAVARLEHAERALATGSGMGAIASALIHFTRGKRHVVAQRSLYAATTEILTRMFPTEGIETEFFPGGDTGAICDAIRDDTALVYLETPSNPLMEIADIAAVAAAAQEHGVPVLVDNTFASPLNQRPLELGATLSIHSATKYLGGHSDATAGVLCGDQATVESIWGTYKMLGPTLAPMEAFLVHRGLKTLALRMERHNANALALARFLESHPQVRRVHHPGLPGHPGHEVARRQMVGGFGGMLSFELEGGFAAGKHLMEAVRLCVLGVSLGGVESLIQHPASMTHGPLSPEQRERSGITEGLVRLSVGIEHIADLEHDLSQALEGV